MMTLPSCDIISPAPTPNNASANLNSGLVQLDVDRADQDEAATTIAASPIWTTSLGEARRTSFGPASAATSMVTDIGSSRLPVSNASSRARPGGRPEGRRRCPSARAAGTSASPDRRGAARCAAARGRAACPGPAAPAVPPTRRRTRAGETADDQEGHEREPERRDAWPPIVGASRGCIQPHSLLCSMPKTMQTETGADSAAPTKSSCGGCSGPAPAASGCDEEDREHDQDLADEDERQEKYVVTKPPMTGPTATAAPATPPMIPYATPVLPLDSSPRRAQRSRESPAPRRAPPGTTSRRAALGRFGLSAVMKEPSP